jgi:Protein of unknown function (DUF1761)
MDMSSAIAAINYWAVLAAAVASFLVGGLWYSPALFHKPWMQAAGLSEQQLQNANLGVIFGVSLLLQLIAAFVLAMFLGPSADLAFGVTAGAMVAVAWVATAFGVVYLFERRPQRLFWINAGYQLIAYTLMGAILGAWR